MKKELEAEFVKQYIGMLNNKFMKNYEKNTESSYLIYLDASNLSGWTMSQKVPVNGFKWVEKLRLSRFNEIYKKLQ